MTSLDELRAAAERLPAVLESMFHKVMDADPTWPELPDVLTEEELRVFRALIEPRAAPRAPVTEPRDLSPRQREALLLAAKGMTTAEVAERMGITPAGVRMLHLRAFGRLHVRSMPGAWHALGWLNVPREDFAASA